MGLTNTILPNKPLRQQKQPVPNSEGSPHAIVIGAGFGGLAAAIRLGARGYRVSVVDKLDQPGGRARVHRIDGHVFDAGPTLITAPFLFEELWELCGKKMSDRIDMRSISPFYRIRFDNGEIFNYTGDAEEMRKEIRKFSPIDVEGYNRFLKKSEEIFEVGFERLAHVPFGDALTMARVAPAMIKLESFRTVFGLVAKYIKDERLRQVLSFHPLLVGGNPFSTTSIYTLIAFLERKWGVHFPMGGTGELVHGMVELIEGMGGTMRLNTTVDQLLVEERNGKAHTTGIRLSDGEEIRADIVVSNADSAHLYRNMIPAKWRKRWTDKKINRTASSMSLFVWYFGTNKKYDDIAHHTILLGPRYHGLLRDIFDRKVLAKDFSLYLHRPTATDPSMAPNGCESFYVLSPVPHMESGVDWSEKAEEYRDSIATYLEDAMMPGLRESITASEVLTPQGFEDDYLSFRGAAFGVQPTLLQSAYFRPHNKSEDIEGLYLVGAGTHPGAGMPGVLSSARVLDSIVPNPESLVRARR